MSFYPVENQHITIVSLTRADESVNCRYCDREHSHKYKNRQVVVIDKDKISNMHNRVCD